MRSLRFLLLICALLCGQIQICSASYLTPDGRDCPVCSEEGPTAGQGNRAVIGDDCRACCKLTCKSVDSERSPAVFGVVQMDLAIPAVPILVIRRPVVPRAKISYHVQVHFANGPPRWTTSRAPPAIR